MITQLVDEVFTVYTKLLDWEETNNVELFTVVFDPEDLFLMLFETTKAVKLGSPPDMVTDTNDWCLFILNTFIEFAADYGVNNIKSIIQNQDRWDIADAAELAINNPPLPYNSFLNHQQRINGLFVPE